MTISSIPKKALRVYRQEGGRELLWRAILKLRERWARIVIQSSQNLTTATSSTKQLELTIQDRKVNSVDIVICVHNALDDIKRCLLSLVECQDPRARILLVDDGSAEVTASFLQNYASENHLRLIRNDVALGYTFAANQGLRASSADGVVLLNSDTIVTPGWLQEMLKVMASDVRIGIVGPLSNTASWQSIPHIEEEGDWKTNAIPKELNLNQYAAALRLLMPKHHAEVGFING
ncbi:MAG: glycosyltransferase family 2 protein, partial [Cyanobacteriota bacterium]